MFLKSIGLLAIAQRDKFGEGQIRCSPLLATLLAATSDCVKQAKIFAKKGYSFLIITCKEY